MDSHLLVDTPSPNTLLRRRYRRYLGWAVLIVYALLLTWRACGLAATTEAAPPSLRDLRDLRWVTDWAGGLALGTLLEFACFAPVGFGAACLVPPRPGQHRRWPIHLPSLAVGIALTALPCAVRMGRAWYLAAAVGLLFPLLGCLSGVWAGTTWRRGWPARLWFGPKLALLTLLLVLGPGALVWFSLEETPFPFEAAAVSSTEAQRLSHLVRHGRPRSANDDPTRTLQLTEHDTNALLSWGFSSETSRRKAMVRLRGDVVSLLLSWPARLGQGRLRYLNLEVTGSTGVAAGTLRLQVDRCRIGTRDLPHGLVACLGPLVASWLNHDRQVQPYLHATEEVAIEPNFIRLTWRPMDLALRFRHKLPRLYTPSAELLDATRAQVEHLLLLFAADPLPERSTSFNLCLKTAFALARNRSTQHEAVTENQAAILALGILLGHPGIEDVMGPVLSEKSRDEARLILTRVVLHGRSDWTRHFCVSAALAVLADKTISDACGVLKEELDAEANGSGFSFADLLVDRTGTVFAVRATRDETAARTLQDFFRHGFRLEEICPPADGLPEGVSETELHARYGGTGGEGYRRLLEEIERRIAACAVYQ
jgi:hypothetical protein